MGTCFYLKVNPCPHCGRSSARLHIGKSSAGWCFGLHVEPSAGVNDLEDWRRLWSVPTNVIEDENGVTLSPDEMENRITGRSSDRAWGEIEWFGYRDEADFHRSNGSERGPNNLLRSRVDGVHCIGHGKGTWDLIVGEFS